MLCNFATQFLIMKKNKTAVILVIFFILLGAAFSFYYYNLSKELKKPDLMHYGGDPGSSIRPFSFANQDGDTITEQDVKGKILVVEYFFTTCKSICPVMNDQMARVYDAFRMDDNVLILSHTVDPKNDTVAAMKAYSLKYDADPKKWMFLTGTKEDLYNQAYHSYKLNAIDSSTDIEHAFIHSNQFVLVDKNGRLRANKDENDQIALYDGTDTASVDQLIKDIKTLETEK